MLRSKAFSLAFYPCSSNNILFRDDLDHSSTPLRLLDDEFDDCKSNTASFIPNNKSTASTSLSSSSTLKQRKRQTATLPTSNTNNSIEKASSPSRTSTTSSASPSTSSPRVVRRIGTKSDEFELPPGWKKIFSKAHEKYFFVYDLKRTTWVDPRDELWKKKTWSECNSNETPYGWEIATDELLGTFFIDHLSHRNVIDDPRTDILQRQIKSVKLFLDESSIIDLEEMRRAVESTTLTESGESSPQTPSSLLQASFIKLVKEKHGIICRGLQQVKEVVAIVEADVIDQLNSQKITQLEINSNKEILAKSLESRTELLQKINCSMSPVAPASASTVVSAETKMVEIEQSNSTTATTTNAPATAAPSYTTLVKKGLINKATKRLITRMEREIENIVVKARLDLIVNQLDLLQIANESQCGMEEDMMEEINQTSFPLFDKLQTIVKCT